MKKFLVGFLSNVLFFYSRKKRKKFRVKFSDTAIFCRKLRKLGIIGGNTYINPSCSIVDKRTRIGKFCSIGKNVAIGTSMHPTDWLSTHPVSYMDIAALTGGMSMPEEKMLSFAGKTPVTIGNDVWIGMNVIIMDGVEIGDGAIIGSGAVVTRNIPPYAIAVGVPAKVIKYRFSENVIARLQKTRWFDQPEHVIKSLPFNDVESALRILEQLQ